MKNEDAFPYNAGEITDSPVKNETMLSCARIRLVGHSEPTITIRNRPELEKFISPIYADAAFEEFRVIAVDSQCRIIAESVISEGSLSEVSAYPRKIAAFALLANAHSIFLCHNHPGGTCAPSGEDISSTIQIEKAMKLFGIPVLDHMIYAGPNKVYSMRQHGDF